jgi:hypothetical protein
MTLQNRPFENTQADKLRRSKWTVLSSVVSTGKPVAW